MQKKIINKGAALLLSCVLVINQWMPVFAMSESDISSGASSTNSSVSISAPFENNSPDSSVSAESLLSSLPKNEGDQESKPSADLQTSHELESSSSSQTELTTNPESSVSKTIPPAAEEKPTETYGFEPYDNSADFSMANYILSNQLRASLAANSNYTINLVIDDVQFLEQWYNGGHHSDRWYPKRLYETGEVAYCIEQGVSIPNVYQGGYSSQELSADIYQKISLADYFGRATRGGDALRNEFMVQMYLWDLQGKGPTALYYEGHPEWAPWVSLDDYAAFKREIQPKVDAFFIHPSFSESNLTLKPGQSVILTDVNGSLAMYEDTPYFNDTGLIIEKFGNNIKLTATASSKKGIFRFRFKLPPAFKRGTPLYYKNPNSQDLITTRHGDPAGFKIDIAVVKDSKLQIAKAAEDGSKAGFDFRITSTSPTYSAVYAATGVDYSVVYDYQYYLDNNPDVKSVIGSDPQAVLSHFVENGIKEGRRGSSNFDPHWYKSNHTDLRNSYGDDWQSYYDHYRVYGNREGRKGSAAGGNGSSNNLFTSVQTTGADGTFSLTVPAFFVNGGKASYRVEEINTPARYNTPAAQTVTVESDQTKTVSFYNSLKNASVHLVKQSEDGIVAGINLELTGGGQTYNRTTGNDGTIDITGLRVYDNNGYKITYTAREIATPGRYTNPASQSFTLTEGSTTTVVFQNNLKKGTLRLIKKAEDGIVSGIKLELTGGGQTYNRTTGDGGIVDITGLRVYDSNNNKIQYTAREIETPGRYIVPASQTFTLTENVTTTVTFSNILKKGSLQLIKKAEDGIVSGIKLELTGGGQTYNRTTGDGGTIDITGLRVYDSNNNKIQYTAREFDTPLRYVQPVSQTFTLTENQTTTITFVNNLKKGNTKLVKASEDDDIAGKDFRITGAGQTYERKTGNGGIIDVTGMTVYDSNNVKITYTAQEINVPDKYVIPPAQTFTLEYGQTTTLHFSNVLKKWQLTVNKKDSEQNSAQGDATLAGAKYGIYKGDTLLDTYITDSSHSFTTRLYVCGSDYTLREIAPSIGYLLDSTVYQVGVTAGQTNIEINVRAANVKESVIKGIIGIIKHTDNGETQIETPEVGAEFDVFLKSAGSYANAKESERDHLICDEDGYDQTKRLPYGVYVVKQTKSWDGRDLLPAFEVYIAKDSKTYRYIINNSFFEGYLKISKKDAETGNVIPYAGAGFQILDPAGDLVKMRVTYPKHMEIDTFYTADDGTLITPQKLPYGLDYQLIEVQAPFGYILDSTPVEFDITQDLANEENGIKLVKVEKSNKPQMGRVTLTKTGEALTTVNETDGTYLPTYEQRTLSDAVYEIIAKEDIVTPDGTVRALAGHVVDELHTGYVGKDISQALYLGKYQAIETKAPEGYVLDDTPIDFELTYAGQEVTISKTEIAAVDERQKVKISLAKIMEQDVHFRAGTNGEIIDVQFGLFAAQKITARDGTIIPADGLIETIVMKADGTQTFKTDLPFGKYYLQEMATNAQYILSDTKYPVEFAYQGQDIPLVEIAANDGKPIENTLKRGSVTLIKTDKELPDERLSGAEFEVYQDVDGSGDFDSDTDLLIGSMKETGQGIYTLDKLTYGSYLVYEKTAPEGFLPSTKYYPFKIVADGDIANIETTEGNGFENQPIKGILQLTKTDKELPNEKLSGAVFEVYQDANGNGKFDEATDLLIGSTKETKPGIYTLDNLRYGSYLVYEKTAPEGFLQDTSYYPFKITDDGKIVEVETTLQKGFENQPIKGILQLAKTDKELPNETLSGAVFEVYQDSNGNGKFDEATDLLIGSTKETKPGIYTLDNLRYGSYLVYEKTAPEGFLQDTSYYPFEITDDGKIVAVETVEGKGFENQPMKGSVELTKVDKEYPENKLSGAVFEIYQDMDGDGKYNEKTDMLYGEMSEQKDGLYILEGLRYGKYLAYEKTAPTGFVQDTSYYPFSITENGQLVTIETAESSNFVNRIIKGTVEGKKLTEDGKALKGALIGLFSADKTEYTKETAVMTALSADDGSFYFADVPFGQYKIKEISAPDGYQLSDKLIDVKIDEDGQIVTVEMVNIKTPENPLPKTGDTSNIAFLRILLIVSFIGMMIATFLIRKNKKGEEKKKRKNIKYWLSMFRDSLQGGEKT